MDALNKFAPVQIGFSKTLLTFLYLFFLINGILATIFFVNMGVFDSRAAVILFIDSLAEGGIIYSLVIPLVLTLTIHKSFLQGLIAAVVCVALYLAILIPQLSSEERGYIIFGLIAIVPTLSVTLGIGMLLRIFFRFNIFVKILLLLIPFVVMFFFISTTIAGTENVTAQSCISDQGKSPEYKYSCLDKVAELTSDSSVCATLGGGGDQWRDACYGSFAAATNKPNLCDMAWYYKGNCYWKVAEKYKDESICLAIKDQSDKERCYSGLAKGTKNPAFCENIKSVEKETCLAVAK